MDEQLARGAVAAALRTVRPGVAMSLDGLVLTALHWDAVREPAYETAGAALAAGELDLREQGSGTVLAIEAATKSRPVVIFAGDTVVGGRQNRVDPPISPHLFQIMHNGRTSASLVTSSAASR